MKWPAAVELNFFFAKNVPIHSVVGKLGLGGGGGGRLHRQNAEFLSWSLRELRFCTDKSAELQSSCNDLLENCDAIKFAFVLKCKQTQCSLSGQIMNMHDLQNRFTLINHFFYSLSIINSLVPGPLLLRTQSLHSPPPTSSIGESLCFPLPPFRPISYSFPCLSHVCANNANAWLIVYKSGEHFQVQRFLITCLFYSLEDLDVVSIIHIYICNKVLTSLLFRAVFVNLVNISILFAYVHL